MDRHVEKHNDLLSYMESVQSQFGQDDFTVVQRRRHGRTSRAVQLRRPDSDLTVARPPPTQQLWHKLPWATGPIPIDPSAPSSTVRFPYGLNNAASWYTQNFHELLGRLGSDLGLDLDLSKLSLDEDPHPVVNMVHIEETSKPGDTVRAD